MKTTLHRIKTEDGLILHGVLYEPEEKTDTVLAHVHGMGGNFYENKFLDNIAKTLTDNGIAFCTFNNRGNGHVTDFVREIEDKKDFITYGSSGEKFEDCIYDIQAQINFVKAQGYKNVHISGHSLGAPKVAYYASNSNEDLKSVIFISPSDMLGLVRGGKDTTFGDFPNESKIAKEMVDSGKNSELMPVRVWGEYPITASTYMNLFGDDSKAAIFNFHNKELGFEVISKIDKPALSIMGSNDDVLVIAIDEIMQTIKDEMKSSPKVETKIIEGANHGYQKCEEELAQTLLNWIKG